jgi:MtN3 and saliva related transmembrane protein
LVPGRAEPGAAASVSIGGGAHEGRGEDFAMELATLTGAAAALCSTASFAPQAWKIIRTRDTAAISGKMYLLTVAAFALWLGYGLLRRDLALILPNAVCLGLSAFILVMKYLPQRQKEAVASALDPEAR